PGLPTPRPRRYDSRPGTPICANPESPAAAAPRCGDPDPRGGGQMTITSIPDQPITAAVFLFGETQDSVEALAHVLQEEDVVGALCNAVAKFSRAGRNAVVEQISTVAHGLLDLDLGGLVIAGWGKYVDLRAAAMRTVAAPDSTEVVQLATHTIS